MDMNTIIAIYNREQLYLGLSIHVYVTEIFFPVLNLRWMHVHTKQEVRNRCFEDFKRIRDNISSIKSAVFSVFVTVMIY